MKRRIAILNICCLLLIFPVYSQPADQPNSILNLYDAFGRSKQGTTLDWGYSALIHYNGKVILFDSGKQYRNF